MRSAPSAHALPGWFGGLLFVVFLFLSTVTPAHASFAPVAGTTAANCDYSGGGASYITGNGTTTPWSVFLQQAVPDGRYTNLTESIVLSSTTCAMLATATFNGSGGYTNTPAPTSWATKPFISTCPANSTLSGSSCTCDSGFMENSTHSACVPESVNVCSVLAGQTTVTNGTVGYSPTPTGRLIATGVVFTGSMCVNGCQRTITAGESVGWVSDEPTASGLYRHSIDYKTVFTGAPCTTESPGTNPLEVPSTCPGFVGQVNGKTTCVGTSGSPVPAIEKPVTPGAVNSGNPAAGDKPASGAGSGDTPSGRTPSTGSGGPAGGPASSVNASGVGGNGNISVTVNVPEIITCGKPGSPPCKIDETGTPDGNAAKTAGQTKLNEDSDALTTAMQNATNASGKDTSWGIIPHWLVSSETCHPVTLIQWPQKLGGGTFDFDICPLMPKIVLVMNLLWTIWTFGATVAMVFRVTTSSPG